MLVFIETTIDEIIGFRSYTLYKIRYFKFNNFGYVISIHRPSIHK